MIIFENTWALVFIGIILLLHVLSAFVRGACATVLCIINIALHIALLAILIIGATPLEESVLAYMLSVFVYTLVRFVLYEVRRRER